MTRRPIPTCSTCGGAGLLPGAPEPSSVPLYHCDDCLPEIRDVVDLYAAANAGTSLATAHDMATTYVDELIACGEIR